MSDSEEQLKRMVMTFRVSELQMLLGYAGKNKTGRKNELQSRAVDIVRMRNPSIQQKIRELYKSIQLEMMSFGDRSQAAAGGTTPGIIPNQRVPSIPSGYSQSGTVGGNMTVAVNSSGYSSRSSAPQVGQVTTMSGTVGYTSLQPSPNNSYPISPDVRLKNLPFYDILGELLKPSTLAPQGSGRYQEGTFTFSLTPQQANKIAHSRDLRPGKQDYSVQVQMRFCLLETTSEQEDNFPPNITVKINDKMCPLPSPIPTNKAGVEPKRPSRPVNVTALCRISPTVTNRILVSWSSDYARCYVISVYLVQKLTSEDLLHRLKSKGPRLGDFTRSLIKQKLKEDGECEIATTSLRCSLLCPLGKMRMVLPCRAETCNHLQCFDASLFLQMNERKPTWTCPVCDRGALYDNLVIDGYFQEVLQENTSCTEVTLHKDGAWAPLYPKKEPKEPQPAEKRKSEVAIETLSDDSEDSEEETKVENDDSVTEEAPSKRKASDVVVITLIDSDDDDDSNTAPPPKCTKSNDSWCVGEVDPGKRLIFRKALSSSMNNNGGLVTPNNGATNSATSPGSSGSASPQVICLDSPASSPAHSPRPMAQDESSLPPQQSSGGSSTPVPSSVPAASSASTTATTSVLPIVATSPPSTPITSTTPSLPQSSPAPCPSPLSNPASVAASLASLGSELTPINTSVPGMSSLASSTIPVSITPVPGSSVSPSDNLPTPVVSSGNAAFNLLQDPLATSNFALNPLSSTLNTPAYNLSGGLPNIFNPMSLIPNVQPSTTNANISYRPQDRFL